jgi:hypothetical protein
MQAKVCLRYSYRLCNGLQNNKTSHIFVPGYIACIVDNYCLRICLFGFNLKFNMATRTIIYIWSAELGSFFEFA